jgi:HTH-type transcriptional regulator/antitoxin HipB
MNQIARSAPQIGQAIQRRRKALNMTQADLAQKTGARQSTISALETHSKGTKLQTLLDVLAALDLELIVQPRSKSSSKDIEDIF